MPNKILYPSCPSYKAISNLPLIGKIHCPRVLSAFFSSLFEPFNPYSKEPSVPSLFLDKENRGIIDQISSFGRALEQYHPGKTRTLLNEFAEKYEEAKEDLPSLKDIHAKALEAFKKEHNNILLKISLSAKQKNEVAASFGKFSEGFTALINIYDANKLKETYDLLDAFNETVMQSHQLYIGLSKVISYIESKHQFLQTFKEQFNSIILLKEQFNPNLEDQGFKQINKKKAKRSGLLDLIADVNAILKTLVPEVNPKMIGKNDYVKNELLKIILQKSEEVISFMQTHMEKHRKSVFKKIKAHLKDDISSSENLQNKLEHLPNDKKAQGLLLDLKKMRFYLKDHAPRSSCKTLKEKLGLLLKEQPYLFTKREKIALDCLLENLSVISNGKHFNKEDLQEQLNQCRKIIKELVAKETIFSKITASLSKLGISLLKINKNITPTEHERLTALLNEFTNDPKISFKNHDERKEFSNLKEMLSFDPNKPIPEKIASVLQPQKYLELVEEIEKRTPSKEASKLAIEQELEKLAKNATNLSFIMFIDKFFFNPARDSLFYRNIIQKSEELNSCPKKLFLDELKIQGFAGWKIVSARVCFFVTKHLRTESYFHKTISRTISNYSKMIYRKLEQECTHDQFHTLSQKIVENATIYFHLLGSAILNARTDAQRFPNPEQVSTLIVDQLLSLKLEDNEAPLKEFKLQDLYSELIDDLVGKSESLLLKWFVFFLDKPALISSIIETSIDSLLKPAPNGNASVLNLLIRDSLRILYKKLQQLEEGESQKEHVPSSNPLAEEFVEKLMRSLNEYRDTQQMASFTKIAVANANFMNELRKHSPNLGGVLDQQIKNHEQINYNIALLADFKKIQTLKEEKNREALFILPVLRNKIITPLKKLDKFLLPHPISSETTQENTVSVTEVVTDKASTFIRVKVDHAIKEKTTLALTNLLEAPPSEETLYGLIHQGLVLTNQAIEHPKENKEKQDAVEKEITELLSDISVFIASPVLADNINSLIGNKHLSSKLADKNPFEGLPLLISSVIKERLQNIVNLATEKALYQPELMAQLGRRILLPVNTV